MNGVEEAWGGVLWREGDIENGVDILKQGLRIFCFWGNGSPLAPLPPSSRSAMETQEMRIWLTGYCVLVAWGLAALSKHVRVHTHIHAHTQAHTGSRLPCTDTPLHCCLI